MDTTVLEKFSVRARHALEKGVRQRCYLYALEPGAAQLPADADVVNGRLLNEEEKAQRAGVLRRIDELGGGADGYAKLVDEVTYTWFNRLAAIRYMEHHDFLPSRTLLLSDGEGNLKPRCLIEADQLDLPGLDQVRVLELMRSGDDEALWRELLVAQCDQLAACLPRVFGRTSAPDRLLLPDGLLRPGSVVDGLVSEVPSTCWDEVEVLGWMYQFYNAERKEEFFRSKRKAAPDDIAPATQLFTPEWIVRYMVQNSLGRLWMLNNPQSRLREQMEYYIEPDEGHEDYIRVDGPEEITFCDPACGSGHILVCAFDLLFQMYLERGYRERDIPELILTRNLTGYEVDERAGQIASLALALRAREHDRRFLSREIEANIRVFRSIEIDADALGAGSPLARRTALLDTLAHLGEVGSLFAPNEEDMAALGAELTCGAGGDLFAADAHAAVAEAADACEALARRFDVVVANPPYMGSSSFNPFMSAWMKKNYPDSGKDLCTAFTERGYGLAKVKGYAAMVTMQSWMFLGSFEKMRTRLIDEKAILSMAHLGTRAFDAIGGEVVSVTADVLYNAKTAGRGAYVRLVDIPGEDAKADKFREAIQNPACGWFYRADASTFHDIPGTPIAYWASPELCNAFASGQPLETRCRPTAGIRTGNNDLFLRLWWEISNASFNVTAFSRDEAAASKARWFPCAKGGGYRKWYGNLEYTIDWENDGERLREYPGCDKAGVPYFFQEGVSWSTIASGSPSFRLLPSGCISEHCGSAFFSNDHSAILFEAALQNSSVGNKIYSVLSPGLSVREAAVGRVPLLEAPTKRDAESLVEQCIGLSKADWDSQETSWDFKHHPLV